MCASFLLYRTEKTVVCCRCCCCWSQIAALFVRFQFRCWQFGFPGLTHLLLPVGKFNQGVSAEAKKQTWAEITNQINGLGENHREVCYCHLTDTICENLTAFLHRINVRYTARNHFVLVIDEKSTVSVFLHAVL